MLGFGRVGMPIRFAEEGSKGGHARDDDTDGDFDVTV